MNVHTQKLTYHTRSENHQKCVVLGPVGLLMNAFSCGTSPVAGFTDMLKSLEVSKGRPQSSQEPARQIPLLQRYDLYDTAASTVRWSSKKICMFQQHFCSDAPFHFHILSCRTARSLMPCRGQLPALGQLDMQRQ